MSYSIGLTSSYRLSTVGSFLNRVTRLMCTLNCESSSSGIDTWNVTAVKLLSAGSTGLG